MDVARAPLDKLRREGGPLYRPPAPEGRRWTYLDNRGQERGPFSEVQVLGWISKGHFDKQDEPVLFRPADVPASEPFTKLRDLTGHGGALRRALASRLDSLEVETLVKALADQHKTLADENKAALADGDGHAGAPPASGHLASAAGRSVEPSRPGGAGGDSWVKVRVWGPWRGPDSETRPLRRVQTRPSKKKAGRDAKS